MGESQIGRVKCWQIDGYKKMNRCFNCSIHSGFRYAFFKSEFDIRDVYSISFNESCKNR